MRSVSPENLAKVIYNLEGLNKPSDGATLKPVYQPRQISCMAVTESELRQIGLSNFLTAAFVGIGSALCAFAFDVDKDLYLSEAMPKQVADLAQMVSTLCWCFGIIFFLMSLGVVVWRRDIIQHIREESGQSTAAPWYRRIFLRKKETPP